MKTIKLFLVYGLILASIASFGQSVGIGASSFVPGSRLSVDGGVSVGNAYRTTTTGIPANGLIVQGNLGIGTSSPATKLDVYQTFQTLANIQQTLTSNNILIQSTYGPGAVYWPGIAWYTWDDPNTTKPKAGIWAYGSASGSKLFLGTTNTPATGITNSAVTINENGNVGIGSTSPGKKLDVAGEVRIADGTQGANKVLTSDASGNTSWTTLSAIPGSCFQNVYYQRSAGTYTFTTTAATTLIYVELWGGGGGGSSTVLNLPSPSPDVGAAGGGGGYAAGYVSVAPSTNYTVTVGAGGAAASNGGASTFNSTVLVASGGSKGLNGTPGAGGTASTSLGTAAILIAGEEGGTGEFYELSYEVSYGTGGNAAGTGFGGGHGGFQGKNGSAPGGGGGFGAAGAAGTAIIRY